MRLNQLLGVTDILRLDSLCADDAVQADASLVGVMHCLNNGGCSRYGTRCRNNLRNWFAPSFSGRRRRRDIHLRAGV